MARSLDPCSKGPLFETTLRPVIMCEERICQISVIPGKKGKGIARCSHIERKDQGCLARLAYLFSGLLSPIPYEDSKRICLSPNNKLLRLLCIDQYFMEIVSTFAYQPINYLSLINLLLYGQYLNI